MFFIMDEYPLAFCINKKHFTDVLRQNFWNYVGWLVTLRYVHILIFGTCEWYLIWKTSLCNIIKDFKMRSSWIVQVCPKSNDKLSFLGKTEVITGRREEDTQKKKRQCDHGGRHWSNVATSQRMLVIIRSWKRQRTDFLLQL